MDLLSGTTDDDKSKPVNAALHSEYLKLMAFHCLVSSMNGVAKEKSYINTIKIWATVLLANEDDDMQEDILRFCLLHSNV